MLLSVVRRTWPVLVARCVARSERHLGATVGSAAPTTTTPPPSFIDAEAPAPMREDRPWHEPEVLLPKTRRFRDEELRTLRGFAKVATALDAPRAATEPATAEEVVEAAITAARAAAPRADESVRDRAARILAAVVADLDDVILVNNKVSSAGAKKNINAETAEEEEEQGDKQPPLLHEVALARAALVRRYADYLGALVSASSSYDRRWPKGPSFLERARRFFGLTSSTTGEAGAALAESPTFEAKLERCLLAAAVGGTADRFAAHFALEDVDDDGAVDAAGARRTVEACCEPVGDALADAHATFIVPRFAQEHRGMRNYMASSISHHLRFAYLITTLDLRQKARCVAAWAEPAFSEETGPAPAVGTVDWLMGRGTDRFAAYANLAALDASHRAFFKEMDTVAHHTGADLLRFRRQYWANREENRTSQISVWIFCLACAVVDYAIIVA